MQTLVKTLLLIGLIVSAEISTQATILISAGADQLKDNVGAPMSVNGLVVLVASTQDAVFGSPTDTAFATGDDLEVARWNLSGTGTPGQLSDTANLTLSGFWTATDPLKLYWFPTLTTGALSPGPNTSYGEYRDPTAAGPAGSGRDGSDPWFTPADSGTVGLIFLTTDAGGAVNAPALGNASFTTVPEPSAYATVVGFVCLLGALISRRSSKSST